MPTISTHQNEVMNALYNFEFCEETLEIDSNMANSYINFRLERLKDVIKRRYDQGWFLLKHEDLGMWRLETHSTVYKEVMTFYKLIPRP